jgi:hypothetical protein
METSNNQLRTFAIVICVLFTALVANAQTHIAKAMNDFMKDKYVTGHSCNAIADRRDPSTGKLLYQYSICEFNIPASQKKLLNPLLTAFSQDKPDAYYVVNMGSGENKEKVYISYGEDNQKHLDVGNNPSTSDRVLCFVDKQDTTYRTAYVLTYKENATNQITGTVAVTYGMNPRYKRNEGKDDDSNVNFPFEQEKFKEQMQQMMNMKNLSPDLKDMTLAAIGKAYNMTGDYSDSKISSDVDFLRQFGNLRSLYISHASKKDEVTFCTAIASKVVQLCKHNHQLLNAHEKKICKDSLLEMQRKTDDSFLKGILDEASQNLDK